MIPKPTECVGCPLFERGIGYAPPYGNPDSALIVVAEALGKNEAFQGEPLVGEAGVYWQRALSRLGLKKPDLWIGNTVNCQPPNNWLTDAPWERLAIQHCASNRHKLYQKAKGHTYLTMGVHATRTVLKEVLGVEYDGELENWHGYVLGAGEGPFVIPTFHPSFILQGNHNLFGAFLYDIKRAMEVSSFGPSPRTDQLIVDPPIDWFQHFARAVPDDPSFWLAVDTETTRGKTDPDVTRVTPGQIIRFNFSVHPDQGITVPNSGVYGDLVRFILRKRCTKVFWNERFDLEALRMSGFALPADHPTLDFMWLWHFLQSDLPKGLGFVSPFYSNFPPWKHESLDNPGYYAAADGLQTMRCALGIKKDLAQNGQWEQAVRFTQQLDHSAIYPMERAGIGIDQGILSAMGKTIDQGLESILDLIEKTVPPEAVPWEGGWKKQPLNYPSAFLAKTQERVIVCRLCAAEDVGPAHKCKKEQQA